MNKLALICILICVTLPSYARKSKFEQQSQGIKLNVKSYNDPFSKDMILSYKVVEPNHVNLVIYDKNFEVVLDLTEDEWHKPGNYDIPINKLELPSQKEQYILRLQVGNETKICLLNEEK